MKPVYRRFLKILFSAALGASISFAAYGVLRHVHRSEQWVTHTHMVVEHLEKILTSLSDAETGQRGFILTGDTDYLDPYTAALAAMPVLLQDTQVLMQDNSDQKEKLSKLAGHIHRKLEEMKIVIDFRRSDGLDAAVARVRAGKGLRLMDAIRTAIHDMEDDERQLLKERLSRRDHSLKLLVAFLLFAIVSIVGLLISLFSESEKRAEAQTALEVAYSEIRQSEERQRLLIEGAKDFAIYMLDPQGKVSTWSNAATRIKGYHASEVIGTHFRRFFTEADISDGKPERALQQTLAKGRYEDAGWQLKKDGTPYWAEVFMAPVRDQADRLIGFSKVVRDATEQKRTEETLKQKEHELTQSRKMEAIGRLAGGVAHDFNNLMTGVMGICEDLLGDPAVKSRSEDILEVSRAAQRASLLTKQLLAFSRRQVASPIVLNLNRVIADMQKMLRRLIGEDIELVTLLDSAIGSVRVDPGQVEQVVINLVVNARDAMPQGGKITIETSNVDLGDDYVKRHFEVKPGPYVMMVISDSGTGIAVEIQNQIFEPFFTTKDKDKGTGLGLATVYGIVKQNGGDIFVYSHPGEGTVFKIYLPRVNEPAQGERRQAVRADLPKGSETILLVEDEDIVRRVAARALTKQGYKVLEARSGKDALEVTSVYTDPIHLLLTDVVMPGMNGRQLAEVLGASHSQLKVLYMSGYTENIIVTRGILKPGLAFLEKSFTTQSLCQKVRDVLDAPRPPHIA